MIVGSFDDVVERVERGFDVMLDNVGISHEPLARGAKSVPADPVYEGPDIDRGTGEYVPSVYEGPEIDRETGAYVPPRNVAPRAATAAGFPWLPVAAGVIVLAGVGYFVIRRRR